MPFSWELGSWAIACVAAHLCFRGRFRVACAAALLAAFGAVPLLHMDWGSEESVWSVEFFTSARIGLLFGTTGGVVTGASLAALACFPRERSRGLAVFMFVVTGLFIAVSERRADILRPFHPSGEDVWRDEVCIQTTDSTCGPASLATCLHALGLSGNEGDLSLETRTGNDGSMFADLAGAARRHGAEPAFHFHDKPQTVPLPAVAGVTLPSGIGHFIAIVARGEKRYLADPTSGLRPLSEAEHYQWSGTFMSLSSK